jgi:hypothetical protein
MFQIKSNGAEARDRSANPVGDLPHMEATNLSDELPVPRVIFESAPFLLPAKTLPQTR